MFAFFFLDVLPLDVIYEEYTAIIITTNLPIKKIMPELFESDSKLAKMMLNWKNLANLLC